MRTIAIINQKGGCGKTTTAINLSAAAARRGKRVLLIDLDPQGHCALGLSVPATSIEKQIGDALMADLNRSFDATDLTWQAGDNLDLIPSSVRLAALEAVSGGLSRLPDRDRRLEQLLRWVAPRYDLCVLDCPPHIGLLTFNALRASSEIIVPVETSYFALQGAENQVRTIDTVARRIGRSLSVVLLPTMFDEAVRLSQEILEELKRRYGQSVAPITIRFCASLREAASFGQPIFEYAPDSTGRRDYEALAQWVETYRPPRRTEFDGIPVHAPADLGSPAVETCIGPMWPRPIAEGGNRAAELAQRARYLLQRRCEAQASEQTSLAEPVMRPAPVAPAPEAAPIPAVELERRPAATGCRIRMVYRAAHSAERVFIAGDFNQWTPQETPMRFNDSQGEFEAWLTLPPGRYRYRFVVDGHWIIDPDNPRTEPSAAGQLHSLLTVAEDAAAPARDRAG